MKLRLLALCSLVFCLTGCFDMFETFNLNEDGSGVYEIKMDMTRSMSFLAMMKQQGDKSKPKQKIDSVIYYKSVVDTSSTLTAEEKKVLRNSYSKIHIDEDEGEMYVHLFYPFADGKEFGIIQKAMTSKKGSKDMMKALGGVLGKEMNAPVNMEGNDKSELPTGDFTYQLTNGSLTRSVKPSSKPEAKAGNEDMPPQLKEMMKMSFTTTVNLPRPVKEWKGNNGTLSADKKQLKFTKNVDLDAKLVPEDFNFSIDY